MDDDEGPHVIRNINNTKEEDDQEERLVGTNEKSDFESPSSQDLNEGHE